MPTSCATTTPTPPPPHPTPADTFDPASYIKNVEIRFRPEADLLRYVRTNRHLKRVPSELLA